jgi:2-polyprenyl-3-methyl-5-hydroxy-6-metoxy-1,4-benzoquinol methylase
VCGFGRFEERYIPKSAARFETLHGDHTVRYIFAGKHVNQGIVLDCGCGYGYGSKYLADSGAAYVVGVDRDRKSIRIGKNSYGATNLDLLIADASHLPVREAAFDMVASLEVIEHVKKCEDYLAEIKRVLKPNGVLVLSTPNKHHTDRTRLMPLYHLREFYPITLLSLLGKYFSVLGLYGKSVVPSSWSAHSGLVTGLRSAIVKPSSTNLVRILLNRMPIWFLHILRLTLKTDYVPPLRPEDFEISEKSVDTASNLISVCRKAT